MTSAIRRVAAPIAVATAMVASLTACGSGPSQLNSAFVLDGRVTSVDQVQDMLDRIVREQPAAQALAQQHKLDLVAREIVTQLITAELLADVAEAEGISPDSERAENFKKENPFAEDLPDDGSVPPDQLVPQLVYRARGVDAYVDEQLLLAELADTYLGRAQATFDVVQLDDGDAARTLAEQIAARPERADELMEGAAGELGPPQLNQQTGGSAIGVILSGPAHVVYLFPPVADSQSTAYEVVHVDSTEVTDTRADDYDPSRIDPNQLPSLGRNLLRTQAIESDIEISPRFGEWNYASMTVVPKSEADAGRQMFLPGDDRS